MLTDRWQVGQPGVPIAVAVVPFLRDGRDREAVRDDNKMAGIGGEICPPKGVKCLSPTGMMSTGLENAFSLVGLTFMW